MGIGAGVNPSGQLIFLSNTNITNEDDLPIVNEGGSFTTLSFTSTLQNDGRFRVVVTFEFDLARDVPTDGAIFRDTDHEIIQFDGIPLVREGGSGRQCQNFSGVFPDDAPTLLEGTDYSFMFAESQVEDFSSVAAWECNPTDIESLAENAANFNADLFGEGNWNASNITNATRAFNGATAFSKDVSEWNMSRLTADKSINMFTGTNILSVNSTNSINLNGPPSEFWANEYNENDLIFTTTEDIADVSDLPISNEKNSFTDLSLTTADAGGGRTRITVSFKHVKNRGTANVGDGISFAGKDYVIEQFGGILLRGDGEQFKEFTGSLRTDDVPSVPRSLSLKECFEGCEIANASFGNSSNVGIGLWRDTIFPYVTNISFMFKDATNFNMNTQFWSFPEVTTAESMFQGATSFNNGLLAGFSNGFGLFDTADSGNNISLKKLIDANNMFNGATSFNTQLLDTFFKSLLNLQNAEGMFMGCTRLTNNNNELTGIIKASNAKNMFSGCTNLNISFDELDVSNVTDMSHMFENCTSFNNGGVALNWGGKTANVTSMNSMFKGCQTFNQNISGWDVNKVTDFSSMFEGATAFDNGGNTLQMTASTKSTPDVLMKGMFKDTQNFNQDITYGAFLNVIDMESMFENATGFTNEGLTQTAAWPINNVVNMSKMFKGSALKRISIQGLNVGWGSPGNNNTENVRDMSEMFANATGFNDLIIAALDVSKVTNMEGMFSGCQIFNANIGGWNVENVTTMKRMFQGCNVFNNDISQWQIGNVLDMEEMFKDAVNYVNSGIINWQTNGSLVSTNMFEEATQWLNLYEREVTQSGAAPDGPPNKWIEKN